MGPAAAVCGQIFQMGLINDQVSRIIRKAVPDPFPVKLFPENIASGVLLVTISDSDMPAVRVSKNCPVVRGFCGWMSIRKGGAVPIPLSFQIFRYLTIPLILFAFFHRPGDAFLIFLSVGGEDDALYFRSVRTVESKQGTFLF